MLSNLEFVDTIRKDVGRNISQEQKSNLGQFMTPLPVARFMAAQFRPSTLQTCRLLDAGAGVGSLTSAFLDRWVSGGFDFKQAEVTTYEIDDVLHAHLSRTLTEYAGKLPLKANAIQRDFIVEAVKRLQSGQGAGFTHAILNPPYKKINSASQHRHLLRQVGIETVNLYSAFVALTIELMETGGEIVAIIPRSFCNGAYYRSFRESLLKKTALKHIHLFDSRNKAFKEDAVLQENVIITLEKNAPQGEVTVSTSFDDSFADYKLHRYPFERIVFMNDPEKFIHVPTSPEHNEIELSAEIIHSLKDIGLEVSTGAVVDFRVKDFLCAEPETGAVPLLYPNHFSGCSVEYPKKDSRKPNAIRRTPETEKWLYPNGCYVVVRRFSSKEEKRRVVASVVLSNTFDAPVLGFENHLNVFHFQKKGLPEDLAVGLAAFLNSTAVDENFRRFSGHTQVNATDLRTMKYPSRETLIRLGQWTKAQLELSQKTFDKGLELITWLNTKI
ncbi:Eco57I restriction-modification methylase domain-containing protein [Methylomicrobium lacus]|uniref:Eco57I restriction-modification methylase domain-containing protein n=1 Tax=Methylomicrobium lacus TaxID=136992 RepID=UPI0035A8FC42